MAPASKPSPFAKIARVGSQMIAMKGVVDAARDLDAAVKDHGGFKNIDRCPREFKKLHEALEVLDDVSERDDG